MTIASGKLSRYCLCFPSSSLELQIFSCTRLWPLYSLALLSLHTSLTPSTLPEPPLPTPCHSNHPDLILNHFLHPLFPLSPCPTEVPQENFLNLFHTLLELRGSRQRLLQVLPCLNTTHIYDVTAAVSHLYLAVTDKLALTGDWII